MLIWLFTLTIIGSANSVDETQLFHEHGFLAKDQGTVYLNTNDEYFSVVVHLAIPQFKFLNMRKTCHEALSCGVNRQKIENCGESNWTDTLRASNLALSRAVSKIEKFNSFTKPTKTIHKRSLGSLLGIGAGVFSTIFTAVSTAMISNHLKRVENDLQEFKNRQNYINGQLIDVQKHLIKLVEHTFKEIRIEMHNLECQEVTLFQFSALRFSLENWYKKLDDLFFYIDRGALGGKLNSFILSPSDISKIIADHKQLMETEYSSNSMNFYLASNIYLLQAELSDDKNFLILHYVLQTPMLFNYNAHKLLKIERVPLKINNVCMLVDAPKYMYKSKNLWEFFDLNDQSCFITELISICYETVPQTRIKSPCLHNANCTEKVIPCMDPSYVYHYSGVLISGTGMLHYLKKNAKQLENRIVTKEFSKVGIAWVSWNEAEYVQYNVMRLNSPSHVTTVLNVNYPDALVNKWVSKLLNRSISVNKKFNKSDFQSFTDQLELLKLNTRETSHTNQYHIIVLVYVNSSILGLLVIFIICSHGDSCICSWFKNLRCKSINTKGYHRTEAKTSEVQIDTDGPNKHAVDAETEISVSLEDPGPYVLN